MKTVSMNGHFITIKENDGFLENFINKQNKWRNSLKHKSPFLKGDKVYIKSINGGGTTEKDIKLYRSVQTVERVTPLPVNGKITWSIDLVGVKYMFTEDNIEKVKK